MKYFKELNIILFYYLLMFIHAYASDIEFNLENIENAFANNIPADIVEEIDIVKNALLEEQPEILTKINKLTSSNYEEGRLPGQYGGKPAEEIFKLWRDSVAIPIASLFLKHVFFDLRDFFQNSSNNSLTLIQALLKWLGEQRHFVAVESKSMLSEYFGKFTSNMMMDPINTNSFPAWDKFWRNFLFDAISHQETLLDAYKNKTPANLNFIYRNANIDASLVKSTSSDWMILKFEIYGNPKEQFAYFSGGIPLNIMPPQHGNLEEGIKTAKGMYVFAEHLNPKLTNGEIDSKPVRKVAKYFKEIVKLAINNISMEEEDELKINLAHILRWLSISSTFGRGQAAITEWLMAAICNALGFELEFSPNWSGPEHMNPDMHALSSFNIDEFVEEFKSNTMLIPK